jgi:hypothetical protein
MMNAPSETSVEPEALELPLSSGNSDADSHQGNAASTWPDLQPALSGTISNSAKGAVRVGRRQLYALKADRRANRAFPNPVIAT